jgi:prefoldin subunit 5
MEQKMDQLINVLMGIRSELSNIACRLSAIESTIRIIPTSILNMHEVSASLNGINSTLKEFAKEADMIDIYNKISEIKKSQEGDK